MKKPLGVWFSLALVLFVIGNCGGYYIGKYAAGWRFRQRQQALAKSDPQRARVFFVNAALLQTTIPNFYLEIGVPTFNDPNVRKKFLQSEISALQKIRAGATDPEIRSVAEMNLGFAHVYLALTQDESKNTADAKSSMEQAQAIFRSLGWNDTSEAHLRDVAHERLRRFQIDGEKRAGYE